MQFRLDLPAFDDNAQRGTLAAWSKREGDPVAPGEDVCEVHIDHHRVIRGTWSVIVTAAERAVLRQRLVPAGARLRVGQPLAVLSSAPDEAVDDDPQAVAACARLRVVVNQP